MLYGNLVVFQCERMLDDCVAPVRFEQAWLKTKENFVNFVYERKMSKLLRSR